MKPLLFLLWQAPLVVASFLLFRSLRFGLRRLVALHQRRHPEEGLVWRPTSGELLNKPLVLPILMTEAPRWNPHALTASLGPFAVAGTVRIRTARLMASARFWSVVINAMLGRRLCAGPGSGEKGRIFERIGALLDHLVEKAEHPVLDGVGSVAATASNVAGPFRRGGDLSRQAAYGVGRKGRPLELGPPTAKPKRISE